MIIVVQDGKCIGLSSTVDLICIGKLTVFALILDECIVFSRQYRNRLLEVIEAWRIAHFPEWMSLLKMTPDIVFPMEIRAEGARNGDIGAFLEF